MRNKIRCLVMLLMGIPMALTSCNSNDNDGGEIVICPSAAVIKAVVAQENVPLIDITEKDIVLSIDNIVACNPETGEFKLKDVKRIEESAYPLPTQKVIRFYADERFLFEAKLNCAISSYLPSGLTFTHWWTDADGCAKFELNTNVLGNGENAEGELTLEQRQNIEQLYQILKNYGLATDQIDYNWNVQNKDVDETIEEEEGDDSTYTYSIYQGTAFYMDFPENDAAYSPEEFFTEYLPLPEDNTFKFGRDRSVELNGKCFKTHEYHQYYQDVKVAFSAIILHYATDNNELLSSVNGSYYDIKSANTNPKLSVEEAKICYACALNIDISNVHEQSEMVVLPLLRSENQGGTQEVVYRLAYHLRSKITSDIGEAYIDARTGSLLLTLSNFME